MTQYDPTQIIHEPTHLIDCSSSCIDLIFISQNNLVTLEYIPLCIQIVTIK